MTHPRFPAGMPEDARVALADELEITLAAYPQHVAFAFSSPAHALTGYAQRLVAFDAATIREGFEAARAASVGAAPTPTQVEAKCAELLRRSRVSVATAPVESPRVDPDRVRAILAEVKLTIGAPPADSLTAQRQAMLEAIDDLASECLLSRRIELARELKRAILRGEPYPRVPQRLAVGAPHA